jgi:hypothetical protein
MNKYCAYLNIPFSLFKEGIDPFQFPKTNHVKLDKDEVLSDDLQNWFTFLKLEISLVEVFYSPPNKIGVVHIDSVGGDYTKLNWQFGGKDSVMNWYSETMPNSRKKTITSIGTNSISLDENTLTKSHSQAIQNPSLIQVGVPHNIENFSEDRWVVSVVYKYPVPVHNYNTFIRPTWDKSILIFNEYLI